MSTESSTQGERLYDLEDAIAERWTIGVTPLGPLTEDEQRTVDSYEAYCAASEAEYELEQQHGGRTRCRSCDQFEVEHRTVEAHRDPTDVGICRACGHVEI